jgi:hypothetical protein
VRSFAPPGRVVLDEARCARPVRLSCNRSPGVGALPRLDVSGFDGITFQSTRKTHSISTTGKAVRSGKAATKHVTAPVARLGCSLLCEVFALQSRSNFEIPNVGDVSVNAAACLERQNAIGMQAERALQASYPFPDVSD